MRNAEEYPRYLQPIANVRDKLLDKFAYETGETYDEIVEALEEGTAPVDGAYEYAIWAHTLDEAVETALWMHEQEKAKK